MTEPRSLNPRPLDEGTVDNPAGGSLYWRKADGWIVSAQANQSSWHRNLRKGMTPLPQYGTFTSGHKAVDNNGVAWNPHLEPWRLIFQRGGAKEFPAEQVIAYHWHIAPPYGGVEFPQIAGVELESYECPECEERIFTSAYDLAIHLRLGHKWGRAELTEYGREAQIDFSRPRISGLRRSKPAAKPQVELEAPQAIPRMEEYRCDVCGWSPVKGSAKPGFALAGHKRLKHKVAAIKARRASGRSDQDGLSEL